MSPSAPGLHFPSERSLLPPDTCGEDTGRDPSVPDWRAQPIGIDADGRTIERYPHDTQPDLQRIAFHLRTPPLQPKQIQGAVNP